MSLELRPAAHRDRFNRTINRGSSPLLANGLPLATIMIGSLAPLFPIIAEAPIIPPLGFMLLLAWRIVRPGLLPIWIGAPLGAFDDLFSGQPFGCAIFLWSVAMLVIEGVETRFPWRGFWQDWATSTALITGYLLFSALIAGGGFAVHDLPLILPQILLSVLMFPIIARMVAFFDRLRLARVRVIG